jgi:hypothetical protein
MFFDCILSPIITQYRLTEVNSLVIGSDSVEQVMSLLEENAHDSIWGNIEIATKEVSENTL